MIRRALFDAAANITIADDRLIHCTFSDGRLDTCGDIIVQKGIDLSLFNRNRLCLLYHNPQMPAGEVFNIRLAEEGSTCDIRLAEAGVSQAVDEAWGMVQRGILKGISVGVNVIEQVPIDPARPRGGQKMLRTQLLEISIVSLAANSGASITSVSNAKSMEDYNPMTRQERIEYVRRLVAGIAPRPAPPMTPTQYLNHAGRKDRASQIAAEHYHSAEVIRLQRASNPTVEDRLAQVGLLEAPHRLHGYVGYADQKDTAERAAQKAEAPAAPAWTKGF